MPNKIVAIIGRPNVGKSSLFNRLTGKKAAIVHRTPGVTRDRNYGEVEWNGKTFFLIDTGGYVPDSKDTFEAAIREQVKISIDEADIVLFLVDAQSGLTPLDTEIAGILRKEISNDEARSKKIILTINKVDSAAYETARPEFYKLGLGEPMEVSAMAGRRSGDLLDLITSHIQPDESYESDESAVKFAIIGRPNVGKSSLLNAITQSKRNIVTEIPGTTRDSTDTKIKYYGKDVILIDTAGLRKKARIKKAESLEFYSAIRTRRSIERCDVAVIVLDATAMLEKLSRSSDPETAVFKLSREDVSVIAETAELKKGIVLAVNKWDLIAKESTTAQIYEKKIKEHLKTFSYVPLVFTSALTKQRVSKILEAAYRVHEERAKEIKTGQLNSKLNRIIQEHPPSSKSHKEIKINYITQLKHSPPVICFFTNLPSEVQDNYRKFLESKVREFWGFEGVPLTIVFKRK